MQALKTKFRALNVLALVFSPSSLFSSFQEFLKNNNLLLSSMKAY